MKKSELKDGYLLTLYCGSKFFICGDYGLHHTEPDRLCLSKYNDNLIFQGKTDSGFCMDVYMVEYMGDLIWKNSDKNI